MFNPYGFQIHRSATATITLIGFGVFRNENMLMKTLGKAILLALPLSVLAACGGGGGSSPAPGGPAAPVVPAAAVTPLAATGSVTDLSLSRYGSRKVYVSTGCGSTSGSVLTYNATTGARTTPTITTTGVGACGVAIDAADKIYVAEFDYFAGSVVVYDANGQQASSFPAGGQPDQVAVGSNGKIYVVDWSFTGFPGDVATYYTSNGVQTTPTITMLVPSGVGVGPDNKIYVEGNLENGGNFISAVTTYTPDGTRVPPTITGVYFGNLAVSSHNKIYVVGGHNSVWTYNATGKRINPTITSGIDRPAGIAVDANGGIYVLNGGNGTVTTYNANGKGPVLTITTGLTQPVAIAVH